MAQKGHSGKMTDCGELGAGHRTTYGHFLSKGKWDHEKVETIQRQILSRNRKSLFSFSWIVGTPMPMSGTNVRRKSAI